MLDVIAGLKQPTYGTIEYGTTVKIGYFRQADQGVDLNMRVIDYIEEVSKVIEYDRMTLSASQMLERFFISKKYALYHAIKTIRWRKKKTLSIKSFDARTKYPVIG